MKAHAPTSTANQFDIDEVFRRLRLAVKDLPRAAMFELRDEGYATPFEQLVGSLISARTRDETTLEVCRRLFARARTPAAMAKLREEELTSLLRGASFASAKARDIRELAARITSELEGVVPDSLAGLTAFRGVGPKIAALTLAVGFDRPAIAVDVHVHRVTNRWGYVSTHTPEQTQQRLIEVLPKRYWVEINERLVPFGKWICTGGAPPRCSSCLLLSICRQVGVERCR